jgi:structural maintenance of chromosomes protein 6
LAASELHDALEDAQPQDNRIEALQEALDSINKEIRAQEGQYQDTFRAKNDTNGKQRVLKARIDELTAKIKEADDKIAELQHRSTRMQQKRENALRKKNEAYAEIADVRKGRDQLQESREAQEAQLAEDIEKATAICDRVNVDPGMTPEKIEQLLIKTQQQVDQSERRLGGNRNALLAKKKEAKDAYLKIARVYGQINHLAQSLKNSRNNRLERWKHFRQLIALSAKVSFQNFLDNRRFRGKLLFDHPGKKLEMSVQPDATIQGNKGRQTKQLSGGEKSFTTICLLMSLWEAMGSPIRCLDEFDVFMDQVNRAVSVDMLIDGARESGSKQFVLISPQSLKQDIIKKDVHVIK